MKQGLTLDAFAKKLLDDAQAHRDFRGDTRLLEVAPSAKGVSLGLNTADAALVLEPTQFASRQISEFTGIPAKYWDRMAAEAPALLADNVRHWFSANPSARLLRTHLNGSSKLRAFLSNRYRQIDNIDLSEIVLPLLMQPGWTIASAEITETRMYIQAVSERVTAEVKKGDVVQAGVVISNSEVGAGAVSVRPMVYRLVCTNGLISGDTLRQNHVGRGFGDDSLNDYFSDETKRLDDKAFAAKVRDVVTASVDFAKFERLVARLTRSAETQLPGDPAQLVEVTANRLGLTDDERGSVLRNLTLGGDLSLWGLVNAVTEVANTHESYDRAIELERLGSDVLEFKPSDFAKN